MKDNRGPFDATPDIMGCAVALFTVGLSKQVLTPATLTRLQIDSHLWIPLTSLYALNARNTFPAKQTNRYQ